MENSLAVWVDRLKYYANDAVMTCVAACIKPDATLKINGRSYKIERLLGEGGFSFVYLILDLSSGRHYALKKILISSSSSSEGGQNEAVKEAMKEVEAYRRFKHPNIIKLLDCAVVQSEDGSGKIIYLFLPYYKRGNLQDVISNQSVTGDHMSEKEMLRIFRGTCEAVRAMHRYRLPSIPLTKGSNASNDNGRTPSPAYPPKPKLTIDSTFHDDTNDDEVPSGRLVATGSSTTLDSAVPLLRTQLEGGEGVALEDNEVVFDGDEELGGASGAQARATGEIIPYAHRDIKPGNIMLADDGSPILMDFGSTMKARVDVQTRQQALLEQDIAAEHSTMPYRAPELFDVKTGVSLDEKVDIWSLGCTLFALAYNYSPFEDPAQGGGSIAMSVGSGRYRHPNTVGGSHVQYSKGFKLLIDSMLVVDPAKRPDIEKVIELTDGVLASLR